MMRSESARLLCTLSESVIYESNGTFYVNQYAHMSIVELRS